VTIPSTVAADPTRGLAAPVPWTFRRVLSGGRFVDDVTHIRELLCGGDRGCRAPADVEPPQWGSPGWG